MRSVEDTNKSSDVYTRRVRCAIYTRKSTEEGLNQEFNSLDAQRESAEAYIASQKQEGWVCIPDHYDDGGFTGGNIERPALKRLLKNVEEGKVDCVIVYKVDRLSRSLLDFTRIIEVFDRHGVSFVSVTQQFNTTSSMGRLTLNILLAFAQFEREIISERTRDKMSAARKKGKWVGGVPVLGYNVDPKGGRLFVNEEEAAQVREIYNLYVDHQSLISVVKELDAKGYRTKEWLTKNGRMRHGKDFTKNSLFRLLTNIIYTGMVRYKGVMYSGEHEKIISEELWNNVQTILHRNGQTGGTEVRNKYGASLRGLLKCVPCGTAMVHVYTLNKGKRYRYYVCLNAQQKGWASCPTKSVNAHDIEQAVVEHIKGVGSNDAVIAETVTRARQVAVDRLTTLNTEKRIKERELKLTSARLTELVECGSTDLS